MSGPTFDDVRKAVEAFTGQRWNAALGELLTKLVDATDARLVALEPRRWTGTGPVPDRLTLANAARELLREAEAEGARNKAKLEESGRIRQLMGTL